jgi:hypothetical protein
LDDLVVPEERYLRPDQRSRVASLEAIWRLTRWFALGLKLADRQGELRTDRDSDSWLVSDAQLCVARLRFDVREEWNSQIEWRSLRDREADNQRDGALIATHRGLRDHAKPGLGNNFTDYSDNLTDQSHGHQRWFVRVLGKL